MNDLKEISPKTNQRGILVGKTGSGKTTLAVEILRGYRFILAIDPLHVLEEKLNPDPNKKEWMIVNTPGQVADRIAHVPKLLYQPHPDHMQHESYSDVYRAVFESGNRFVYTDEALRVVRPSGQAPQYLEAVLTAGRQRGIGSLIATQRPSKVDLRILSESEHFYCFALRLPQDLKRMGELMGEEVENKPAKGHSFWYAGEGKYERPRYLSMAL